MGTEKIQLYSALADYILRGAARMSAQERENLLIEVNGLFSGSDNIMRYELQHHISTYVVKAKWEMVVYTQGGGSGRPSGRKENLERARNLCLDGLTMTSTYLPLTLMLGTVYYHLGQPEKAIEQFGNALKAKPGLGADVRVAIAMCHLHRAPPNTDLAEKAIDRALALDPNNVQAISAKALFVLRKRDDPLELAKQAARVTTAFGASRAQIAANAKRTYINAANAHVRKLLDRAMSQIVGGRRQSCPHALTMIAYERHYGKWIRMVGGGVSVAKGSASVATSGDFSKQLKPGQRIRINDVECSLSASILPTASALTLSAPFVGEDGQSAGAALEGAALYKQDFEDAYKSAKQASEASASSSLKAEAHFVMGAALMSLAAGTAAAAGEFMLCLPLHFVVVRILLTCVHNVTCSPHMFFDSTTHTHKKKASPAPNASSSTLLRPSPRLRLPQRSLPSGPRRSSAVGSASSR